MFPDAFKAAAVKSGPLRPSLYCIYWLRQTSIGSRSTGRRFSCKSGLIVLKIIIYRWSFVFLVTTLKLLLLIIFSDPRLSPGERSSRFLKAISSDWPDWPRHRSHQSWSLCPSNMTWRVMLLIIVSCIYIFLTLVQSTICVSKATHPTINEHETETF